MGKNLMKIVGIVQGAIGLLGTAPTGLDTAIQTAQGGGHLNLISGALLGLVGARGTATQQKVGIPAISGLNGIVGLLGLLGANNPLAALNLDNGPIGSLINIAVAVVGFVVSLSKKKSA